MIEWAHIERKPPPESNKKEYTLAEHILERIHRKSSDSIRCKDEGQIGPEFASNAYYDDLAPVDIAKRKDIVTFDYLLIILQWEEWWWRLLLLVSQHTVVFSFEYETKLLF